MKMAEGEFSCCLRTVQAPSAAPVGPHRPVTISTATFVILCPHQDGDTKCATMMSHFHVVSNRKWAVLVSDQTCD